MSKYPDYTQMMEWHFDEPTILNWQIKTIAHQWQKFGYFIIFVMAICMVVFLAILIVGYEDWGTPCMPLVVMGIGALLLFGEVRRKCWMVYRFTQSGGELYLWRAYPKSLFWLIRLLFVGLGVGVLVTGIITKMGLLAIAGPVSIALALGSVAITKKYEEEMKAFTTWSIEWSKITQATYDQKRNVFTLHYVYPPFTMQERNEFMAQGYTDARIDNIIREWDFYIFPTPELTSQVIQLVESSLQKGVTLEHKKIILPEVV